ncbi:hypothetical protein cgp_0076 [Corynebacterium glutamicum MB001]|uniref:Uncharacterized protein n=1 Tax=Corynebacterium glutamicum (strain ATCC 13032 / DSM 20300 / JCM 1318 / BCRC 11384 / CCUG 27702 / LMG 3730 / NBRC 12168 / NCIMB 10025 / NRRL B-2784 / 534) TaxID=196627 RepID=Q8NU82_CORGL|nr:hypothetical protein [Corynebacterium glutamicum]AGT04067.1 hypothetical protein cgp_0076 [Corynebacterium glutamicum MB001]ARV65676.1 hypothetical protein B7P23_12670 [Corynebacterium glutamicum]ASW12847.1 hypothetical protein cgc1_0076 [Corynebacterium glutamicum]AUH99693.1 hypothetical protein CYL77_00330 [Corynebacterium glutamicum]AUI03331.1 hypothetical protein C0I99_04015 [Corynebacterium glutamicum]
MRTVFQLVQDFHKEARGEGLPIKWGPSRGEFGMLEFPADVIPENIKHIAQTKFQTEATSVEDIRRAINLLSDQAERAGASFNPGFILAQVGSTIVEVYGGAPVAWLDAVELLISPDVEWVGVHGSRKLDINVSGELSGVISAGDKLGELLGDDWTINIVHGEYKIQIEDARPSTAFLADATELINQANSEIVPFHVRMLSNSKIVMSGFSDYSLAGDAITSAGKLAELARPFAHWKENVIPTIEIAMDYEPSPVADLWQGDSSETPEPFDDFERLLREEMLIPEI